MYFKKTMPKSMFGFTLIEVLMVISIMGLLSSIILISLNTARMKVRDVRRITDLGQIRLALKLYYDTNGYYPPSGCGWDCNGYRYGNVSASWGALATELAPYIKTLPNDPINTENCVPWIAGCYSYTYGNVGRTIYSAQYDLTAQLEDPNNNQRCAVKNWRYYFNDSYPWCGVGVYHGQIYEDSN